VQVRIFLKPDISQLEQLRTMGHWLQHHLPPTRCTAMASPEFKLISFD
jgi:hypothetical protein